MKTTQEIYEAMLAEVQERSGFAADDSCDLAVRLYTAAAQIASLYAYADWSRRQCFPHTASGEYLDRHAQMHGLSRESAACARGTLRIGLRTALSFQVSIAAGTRYCTDDGLTFVLAAPCTIEAGATYGTAEAVCETAGTQGNVAAGEIGTMVDAPAYASTVTNPAAFTGGAAAEEDEHLRQRILSACRRLPNGANCAYYEAAALALPGITSAAALPAFPSAGYVSLYVSADHGAASEAQLQAVRDALAPRTELGITLRVYSAEVQPVAVRMSLLPKPGCDAQAAIEAAREAITGAFARPLLRQGVCRAELGNRVYNTGLIYSYAFDEPAADLPAVPAKLYTLGTLEVTEG